MKKFLITIFILFALVMGAFGGYYIYSSSDNTNEQILTQKVDGEIAYIDAVITSILNRFNNIEYSNYKVVAEEISTLTEEQGEEKKSSGSSSENNQKGDSTSKESNDDQSSNNNSSDTINNMSNVSNGILVNNSKDVNWNYIKQETEKLYGIWTNILIDFTALNINKDELLKFNSTLDDITKSLEAKDKKEAMRKFADLFNLLCVYIKDYSTDTKMTQLYITKSNVLYAYVYVEYDDKWDDVQKHITNAKNTFLNVMNGISQNSNQTNTINKVYVLLNEMEKNAKNKDKSIFYINYKNMMRDLSILCR